ncbi:MAG: 2-octaprenyl-6-methoxyphenyl hydroxylase [Chromatiales bacterium]|jgi:2-octaprenyl-6-methoxyphenol hydroxylase
MSTDVDVIIAGGGMVGASLAHALFGHGLKVAVIEAYAPSAVQQPSYDDRAIALSYGSQRILDALGVWPQLKDAAEAIKQIHVSDRGHFGFARLDQAEENVAALGYVVTARDLGQALLPALSGQADVQFLCPAQLLDFNITEQQVQVSLEVEGEPRSLTARLLVAADGGRSMVRERLGIDVRDEDYGQTAIVSNVSIQQSHDNVAYERFTDSGPLALLPMTDNRMALVYTVSSENAESVLAMSDADFLDLLQQRFGYRLGRFTRIGERVAYPLRLMQVAEHVRPRVALAGNAAHTVHPIAGQGFNLGIRDVAVLAEVILDAWRGGLDIGDLSVLKRYADWRRDDQKSVIFATDSMVRLFTNPLKVVQAARNIGILAADLLPGARHWIARRAMGLAGRQAKLSRGVRLD